MSTLTIGVDIGGTKVAGGLVDPAGTLLAYRRADTPSSSPAQVVEVIGSVVDALRREAGTREVSAVGLGAAGLVDADRSTVVFAPNLAWRNEPLRQRVSDRVALPVVVENDASAMAWGEYRFGAGRGIDHLVCVTVGTGIGGGLVIAGQLRRGGSGFAGEFGHLRLVPGGRQCGCGNLGCWEQYCSGRALALEAQDIATGAVEAAKDLVERAGGDLGDLTGEMVTDAAREGDSVALQAFERVGGWLGEGLADLAAVLDPSCFVIGGGVIDAGDLLLDPARDRLARTVLGGAYRTAPPIVSASLGPDAGLIGAADLARTR